MLFVQVTDLTEKRLVEVNFQLTEVNFQLTLSTVLLVE